MSKIYLKAYQWAMRAVVELLDLFPPRRIEKEEFTLRKGILPEEFVAHPDGSIWVHGASLGEVITLRPFLAELARQYGRQRIICTSTTLDGLKQLRKDAICGLATLLPIELPAYLLPFMERVRPKLMLISETEIWPLLLDTLARKGVPYGIINARINEKTVRMLRIAWVLFESSVRNMAFVFPQEKHYQRRFRILGIPAAKQEILGCFKYDFTEEMPDAAATRQRFGIQPNRQVICFGSTHANEEEQILDALEPLWGVIDASIIIAPRHLKRVAEVEKLLQSRNLDYCKLSETGATARSIILVDSMGELRNLYAIAALAFVGGSLINHGGHNLMEPASCSKPILTGPGTFNFRYEIMALTRAKAALVVKNVDELRAAIEHWHNDPEHFAAMGKRARQVLDSMSGASQRTIASLQQLKLLPPCQIEK